jgi:hypothetical protein
MKQFNITAQVVDMCGTNPGQSLLYNQMILSKDEDQAKKQFEFDLLVDDIIVQKILSTEEIFQYTLDNGR